MVLIVSDIPVRGTHTVEQRAIGNVVMLDVNGRSRRVLAKVLMVFDVYDSEAEALQSFPMSA